MEVTPFAQPLGLFPVPTIHLALSRVISHSEFRLGGNTNVYGGVEWVLPLPQPAGSKALGREVTQCEYKPTPATSHRAFAFLVIYLSTYQVPTEYCHRPSTLPGPWGCNGEGNSPEPPEFNILQGMYT